jgi:hypothetical protein
MIFSRMGADITRKVSAASSNITSMSAGLATFFLDAEFMAFKARAGVVLDFDLTGAEIDL